MVERVVSSSTAGLQFGGQRFGGLGVQDETETWNGTNWTEVNDLNAAKKQLAGNGTQTSALAYGGEKSPSVADITETELWNGSNWTEVNDLNTSRHYNSGAGVLITPLLYVLLE